MSRILLLALSTVHFAIAGGIAAVPDLVISKIGLVDSAELRCLLGFVAFSSALYSGVLCTIASHLSSSIARGFSSGVLLGIVLYVATARNNLSGPYPAQWEVYAGVVGLHLLTAIVVALSGSGEKKSSKKEA